MSSARRDGAAERLDAVGSALEVIRVDTSDGVCVRVAGEIDLATAPVLATQLQRSIADGDGVIIVNLGDVTFIDAYGIHALIAAHQAAPGRLRLGMLQPAVRKVFEITALLDVFKVSDEVSPR